VSIKKGNDLLRPRGTWSVHGAILVASLLSCQRAWPQATQNPQTQQTSAAWQAPQTQETPHITSTPQKDLTSTSIEDLMNMEVTSASKKEQKLSQVAAAIFVITQEDIRRSGATSIPDALRMVPGVQVAQLDANIWVITIRGFSDRFADKVLVLIDGRTVYTPTTSGVYWDQQDVPVEDVERIEVIRGPGGTIWGANAVNGVINITTKSAKDTKGGLATVSGGSGGYSQGLLQWGGRAGDAGDYRVFGKYEGTGSLPLADGTPGGDAWHIWHTGFRSDLELSAKDSMTIQGDFLRTSEGEILNVVLANDLPQQQTFSSRTDVRAANILERWNRKVSEGSTIALQAYYDGYDRHEEGGYEGRRTFDLDFQNHVAVSTRNDLVWGLGYRVTSDNLTPKYSKSYVPAQRTDNLLSAFVQDEFKATSALHFIAGGRLEHNGYTGFEFEPSAQLVWTPTERQSVWVSAARAVRQPARADTAIQIDLAIVPLPGGDFGVKEVMGDPNRKAEELIAYQFGYRAEVSKKFSFDVATFWNRYHHLQTDEPGNAFFTSSPAPQHFVFPETSSDNAHARTYGVEVFLDWSVTKRWRISPGYTFLQMAVSPDASSLDTSVSSQGGDAPKHGYTIRSQVTLPHNLEWDTFLYFVSALPNQGVPGYNRVDTRVGWRLGESIVFSLVGQNLLTPRHGEFGDDTPLHTLVERRVVAKVVWNIRK
jgi:iron complex outermembrane receptor protein